MGTFFVFKKEEERLSIPGAFFLSLWLVDGLKPCHRELTEHPTVFWNTSRAYTQRRGAGRPIEAPPSWYRKRTPEGVGGQFSNRHIFLLGYIFRCRINAVQLIVFNIQNAKIKI